MAKVETRTTDGGARHPRPADSRKRTRDERDAPAECVPVRSASPHASNVPVPDMGEASSRPTYLASYGSGAGTGNVGAHAVDSVRLDYERLLSRPPPPRSSRALDSPYRAGSVATTANQWTHAVVSASEKESSLPETASRTLTAAPSSPSQFPPSADSSHGEVSDYAPVRNVHELLKQRATECRRRAHQRGSGQAECITWQHLWFRWVTRCRVGGESPLPTPTTESGSAGADTLKMQEDQRPDSDFKCALARCEACDEKMKLSVSGDLAERPEYLPVRQRPAPSSISDASNHVSSRAASQRPYVRSNPLTVTVDRLDSSRLDYPYCRWSPAPLAPALPAQGSKTNTNGGRTNPTGSEHKSNRAGVALSNFALMHWICNRAKSAFDMWIQEQQRAAHWLSRLQWLSPSWWARPPASFPADVQTEVEMRCMTETIEAASQSCRELLAYWCGTRQQHQAVCAVCHEWKSTDCFATAHAVRPGRVVLASYLAVPNVCRECRATTAPRAATDDGTDGSASVPTVTSTPRPIRSDGAPTVDRVRPVDAPDESNMVSTVVDEPPFRWIRALVNTHNADRREWALLSRVERGSVRAEITEHSARMSFRAAGGRCEGCGHLLWSPVAPAPVPPSTGTSEANGCASLAGDALPRVPQPWNRNVRRRYTPSAPVPVAVAAAGTSVVSRLAQGWDPRLYVLRRRPGRLGATAVRWYHRSCAPGHALELFYRARACTDRLRQEVLERETFASGGSHPRRLLCGYRLLCAVSTYYERMEQVQTERSRLNESMHAEWLAHVRATRPREWAKSFRSTESARLLAVVPPFTTPLVSHRPERTDPTRPGREQELLHDLHEMNEWMRVRRAHLWIQPDQWTHPQASGDPTFPDRAANEPTGEPLPSPLDKHKVADVPTVRDPVRRHSYLLAQYRLFLNHYFPTVAKPDPTSRPDSADPDDDDDDPPPPLNLVGWSSLLLPATASAMVSPLAEASPGVRAPAVSLASHPPRLVTPSPSGVRPPASRSAAASIRRSLLSHYRLLRRAAEPTDTPLR